MIQIDEPPAKPFCAQCLSQLVWLWSPSKKTWISWVPCGCERWSLKPHGCRHAQDPKTWRSLDRGEPPNDEYRKARDQIASTTKEKPDALG